MAVKPKTWKTGEQTRTLIEEHIGTSFDSKDPINTRLLMKKIYSRRDKGPEATSLTFEEAYAFGAYLSDLGRKQLLRVVHPLDKAAIEAITTRYQVRCVAVSTALQAAGITPTEVAGISAGVFDWDIPKYVDPKAPEVFDNCGMGGDEVLTPNISNLALLTVSGKELGIYGCKHGSPGNTDAAGSSDFMNFLIREIAKELELSGNRGIRARLESHMAKNGPEYIVMTPEQHEAVIDGAQFGYIEALDTQFKTIHMQTHGLGKLAHINHMLGPITVPANPQKLKKKILGMNNNMLKPDAAAEAYQLLNKAGITNMQRAYFVRGGGRACGYDVGMDEFTTLGDTMLAELQSDGHIRRQTVQPEEFGLKMHYVPKTGEVKEVHGPEGSRIIISGISPELGGDSKKKMSMQLLRGELKGPALDLLIANIASILVLHEHAKSSEGGAEMARQRVEEKQGYERAKIYVQTLDDVLSGRA